MGTVRQLVTDALSLLKVTESGEAITNSEAQDGMRALNQLIDSWANESYMIYRKVQRTHALTSGTGQYSIGSGATINTTRPVKISQAYVRDSNNADYPINCRINNQQWSRILLKSLSGTYPEFLYYRPSYPNGEINLYPEPGSGLTLYMECWDQFSAYTAITDSIALPPGYERALKYNLAIELAPEYRDPSQLVLKLAQESKERIKDVNNINIPTLISDAINVTGRTRGLGIGGIYRV